MKNKLSKSFKCCYETVLNVFHFSYFIISAGLLICYYACLANNTNGPLTVHLLSSIWGYYPGQDS